MPKFGGVALPYRILTSFVSNLVILLHHCFSDEFPYPPLKQLCSLIELNNILIMLTRYCMIILFLTLWELHFGIWGNWAGAHVSQTQSLGYFCHLPASRLLHQTPLPCLPLSYSSENPCSPRLLPQAIKPGHIHSPVWNVVITKPRIHRLNLPSYI